MTRNATALDVSAIRDRFQLSVEHLAIIAHRPPSDIVAMEEGRLRADLPSPDQVAQELGIRADGAH